MTRQRLLLIAFVSLGAAALFVGVSLAQSSCPDCIQQWTFDSDLQGWTGGDWLASKSLGFIFTTNAIGVAHFNAGQTRFKTSTYLGAGTYRLKFRGGGVAGAPLCSPSLYMNGWHFSVGNGFAEYQTDTFTETATSLVTLQFDGDCLGDMYFDYIALERVTAVGTPTATPLAATATPLATATEYCIDVPTATPRAFSLTPVPTATPAPASLDYPDSFERIEISNAFWSVNEAVYPSNVAHSGLLSVKLPSVADPGSPLAALGTTPALIFTHNFAGAKVYVDLWAQADYVGASQTQTLGIWLYASDLGTWLRSGSINVSIGRWYPWHLEQSLDHTYTHLAFTAYGDTSSGAVYVDDVHIYSDPNDAKICGQDLFNPTTGDTTTAPGDYSYTLLIDANRPCPGDLNQPNNFFGPILSGATQFLDFITQNWGAHDFGTVTAMSRDLIASPIVAFATIAALFIDLRVALLAASIIITAELVRAAWSIWILVKSTVFAR